MAGPTVRSLPDPSDVPDPIRFALVDVFGQGPWTGNPLAVLDLTRLRSGDPPDQWLIAVAREMNQAETTFVFAPTSTAAARLRSFTAGGVEVVGAGHNALGAWWWLLDTGRIPRPAPGTALVQEIGGRDLDVEVGDHQLVMRQGAPVWGAEPARDAVCAALGVDELDPAVPARTVGTGADHLLVAVRDREALFACRPDKRALVELATGVGAQGVYVAVIGPERPVRTVHTRFFNPGAGLDEDPATGSAAGPLAAYLHHLGLLGSARELRIDQGHSVGRPSTLHVHVTPAGTPAVGGRAVTTAQGWIRGPHPADHHRDPDRAGTGHGAEPRGDRPTPRDRAAMALELIGVPFDGYGRPGNQASAPRALREAGLATAFGPLPVTDDGDVDLPPPTPQRGPDTSLINETALLAMAERVGARVAQALDRGRFPLVVGGDCTCLLGVVPALRDIPGGLGLVFVDGHEDTMPLDVSEDGEAANTEIGLLLGLTGGLVSGPLRHRLDTLDPDALAMLGQRDQGWRRRFNVGSLREHGVWLRDVDEVTADPARAARAAVDHLAVAAEQRWLHVDLDVLDLTGFAAQGLPGVDDEPGGLTVAQLTELLVTAAGAGGCVGMSLVLYDPDQDPRRRDGRQVIEMAAAAVSAASRARQR